MIEASQSLRWSSSEADSFSRESLAALLCNDIPAIRVPGFATMPECAAFVDRANEVGFDFYKDVVPPIGRIGITQFEEQTSKASYFSKASHASGRLALIAASSFSPIDRLTNAMTDAGASVAVASEPEYGPYFAGLVRHIRTALLHLDFGPLDGPTWEIGRMCAQLAWNIYLQIGESGGECVVYNHPWTPSDELWKVSGSYSYDHEVVKSAERLAIAPRAGELVLFNSRNFHEVLPTVGERLTVSSFIGLSPDGSLKLWS